MSQINVTIDALTKEIKNIEKKAGDLRNIREQLEKNLVQPGFSQDESKAVVKQKLQMYKEEQLRLIDTFSKKQDAMRFKVKSLESLQDHIADIQKEVEVLQNLHDEAMNELEARKEFMKMRIKSMQEIDAIISNLEKDLRTSKSEYSNKMQNLKEKREALLKRTDLSPEEMEKLLAELDQEIEETENEYSHIVKGITTQISNLKLDLTTDPNQLAERLAALEDREEQLRQEMLTASPSRLLEIEKELQEIENQKKDIQTLQELAEMTAMDKLWALVQSKGLKVTESGRIATPSGQILTLEEAKRKGILDGLEDEIERLGLKITSSGRIIFLSGVHEEEGSTDISEATTVSSIETSSSKLSTADTHYLKATVGKPLTLALAEITSLQPSDPIHYLAHWLFKYRYNQEMDDSKKRQLDELIREKEEIAKERLHRLAEAEAKGTMYDLLGRVSDLLTQRQFEAEMQRILEESTKIEPENQNAEDVPYNSPTSEQEI